MLKGIFINETSFAFTKITCKNPFPNIYQLNIVDVICWIFHSRFHEYVNRRHTELGPIFREHIGPLECIFLSSPEMMREVFVYEGKHPRHPIPEAWILYQQEHKNKRGLLFMYANRLEL